MVGVAGFEPATHWSQTSCATKLRYTPVISTLPIPQRVNSNILTRRKIIVNMFFKHLSESCNSILKHAGNQTLSGLAAAFGTCFKPES